MADYAKLVEAARAATARPTMPLIIAEVTAVAGDTATVKWGDLELTDVRLKAGIGGSGDELLITPKVGSLALIGSLTGDLKDLAVLRADMVEKVSWTQGGLTIEIDSATGKVKMANSATSLKDLMQELKDLLTAFIVLTPAGPSSGIDPGTTLALTQFQTHFQQLLN